LHVPLAGHLDVQWTLAELEWNIGIAIRLMEYLWEDIYTLLECTFFGIKIKENQILILNFSQMPLLEKIKSLKRNSHGKDGKTKKAFKNAFFVL
jgi:hypothetical protein